jgi:hypothetical protein
VIGFAFTAVDVLTTYYLRAVAGAAIGKLLNLCGQASGLRVRCDVSDAACMRTWAPGAPSYAISRAWPLCVVADRV